MLLETIKVTNVEALNDQSSTFRHRSLPRMFKRRRIGAGIFMRLDFFAETFRHQRSKIFFPKKTFSKKYLKFFFYKKITFPKKFFFSDNSMFQIIVFFQTNIFLNFSFNNDFFFREKL